MNQNEQKEVRLGYIVAGLITIILLLGLAPQAVSAVKPVVVDVELEGSDVTITFTNNAGRLLLLELDEDTFSYARANRQLKFKPDLTRPMGVRVNGQVWTKPLPSGLDRKVSFTLANPPREPYCLRLIARIYGSGNEATLYRDVSGSGCTS